MRNGRYSCASRWATRLGWAASFAIVIASGAPAIAEDDEEEHLVADFASYFEELVWEIERAGRSGDDRRLEALVRDLDAVVTEPASLAETACWRLLKATVLVELSRYRDASASLGVLADTCPIWEVLNNLAVLEARQGEYGPARARFIDAIGAASEDEKAVPRRNLKALLTGSGLPSLLLAGVPAECTAGPLPAADCTTSSRPVPFGADDVDDPIAAPAPVMPAVEEPEELPAGREPVAVTPPLPANPEDQVEAAIQSWRRAWQERRVDDYFGAYVTSYRPPAPSTQSHGEWQAERRKNIEGKVRIEVGIADLELEEAGEGVWIATFTQSYCGYYPAGAARPWYGDSGPKELELTLADGAWKITSEIQIEAPKSHACE